MALGDGTYAVRFLNGSTEMYYRLDARLPGGSSPAYANLTPQGELWVPLLEKAFAEADGNSYANLNGGMLGTAETLITGAKESTLSASNDTALAQKMADALAAGHAMTAGKLLQSRRWNRRQPRVQRSCGDLRERRLVRDGLQPLGLRRQ